MKEAYRAMSSMVRPGYDIVFVARNTIEGHKEPEVEKVLKKTLQDEGLLISSDRQNK
jgi:RNase P protein component